MSCSNSVGVPPDARTLIDVLRWRAENSPDAHLCCLVREGREQAITFGELMDDAWRFANLLEANDVRPGEVVLIVAPHGPVLMPAFVGTLLRGAVPAFIPPQTEKQEPAFFWRSIREMTEHLDISAWLIDIPSDQFQQLADLAPDVRKIPASAAFKLAKGTVTWPSVRGDATAFLQFSSGTTGIRKGVMLSHEQVLEQLRQLTRSLALSPQDTIVSWLPLYHDMGLIACFMLPLMSGVPVVWLSPFEWVREPHLLFQHLERHRGTLTWLPNFAFRHLSTTVAPERRYDLSGVRAFINCSESCKADTFEGFAMAFGRCGVTPNQLQTCYAMAEAVFAVTHSTMGDTVGHAWFDTSTPRRVTALADPSPGSRALLSVGRLLPGFSLCIDTATGPTCEEDVIGEILLSGPCMAQGYYRNPDATSAQFRDGWYATGDLGFLHDGQLYIAGRIKEVIIVHGKNFFAHDIEAIANKVPGVHPGRLVAIAVDDERSGSEEIVLLVEVDDAMHQRSLVRRIKEAVLLELNVVPRVRPVPARWLTKTTSGKIDRQSNKLKYLNHGVANDHPREDRSAAIA